MKKKVFCILKKNPTVYTLMEPDLQKRGYVKSSTSPTWVTAKEWIPFGFKEEKSVTGSHVIVFKNMVKEISDILDKLNGQSHQTFAILLRGEEVQSKDEFPEYQFFEYQVLVYKP
ncbi:MAG: hypothetical protein ACI88L_000161 [Candidatus Paceibacteria bacterium]|jgi:hypothetical protein